MAEDSIYHEILMPDGKRFRVKKEDWDAKTDKYIHKLSAGKIRMTDSKGNNSYVPVSEYGDAVQNKNMHALRIGWTMNDKEGTLTRSSYKDVYKPAKVAAQPKSQQTQQVQAQPKARQPQQTQQPQTQVKAHQPQTQVKAHQPQPTARQTQAQVAQQRPASRQQTVQAQQPRQQVGQSAQAPQTKQVQAQQARQTVQIVKAQQTRQVQSKGSSSGVLKTAKLRRGGKDYEIPWQEINAEGGLGKYIANHDSKEAPIRVYMRDAKGKLFHVDARQVNNYRGKGYKFEVGQAKRWQPTASEKAAKMAEIQEMANNAKDVIGGYQRSMNRAAGLPEDWNWDDKTNYEQGHAAIEQEKNRRKAAEFGAQLQGVNTKPMGLFSGGGLSDANGGEKVSQQEQSPFAIANAKSPEVNRVVMKDGKPTVEWVLPDGSVTTDIMEADKAEYYARKERGRRSGEAELRKMGLNPLSPMAISTQRAWNNLANEWGEKQAAQIREMLGNSDATKQAWEITDQLYKEADGEMKAAAKRNDEATAAITGIFGEDQEQSVIRQTERLHKNYVDYLTLYDLMDMSDKVWGMMDEDKKDELRKTAREQGYTSAEDIERYARAKSDEVVYDYAKRRNAPKNVLDLFVHRVIGANTVTSLAKGLMRMGTKKQGDLDAKEMAYAEYGKEHPGWNIAGNVFGVGFDPVTWVSGWVGGKAGKFALSLYGRRLEKMYQLAKGAGKGIAAAKGTGKLLAGIAGGAGNFATFEAGGEIKQQIEKGGAVGDDGRVHGYSAGRVIGAAAKGAGMGAVMGGGSHYISKGAAKAISKTDNVWGKAGIASGRTLTNTLWSATVLSIPEWINGEQSPMDVWLENIGTMGGFGLMHGIKAAPRVIRELAPVKNPTTAAERLHNRTSFMERVDNVLSAGTVDTWLTQSDYTELMANGYGDFYDLFKARDKEGFIDTKTKYSTDPKTQEYKDAFVRMEEFVKDERVSQRLRSKMYSMLTGRGLPISGYTRAEYGETPEGEGYVATYAPGGTLVTFDIYKTLEEARVESEKKRKTCQRVAVGYAEDYAESQYHDKVLEKSLLDTWKELYPDAEAPEVRMLVAKYYAAIAKPREELAEEDAAFLDHLNRQIISNHKEYEDMLPETAREEISRKYGVDVDEALRKGIDKQTARERDAIAEYVQMLAKDIAERNSRLLPESERAAYDTTGDDDGNNGGGEAPEDDVPPVEPTDPNGGNDGNVGNEGNERGVSPTDGESPADIQPEQTKVSARMQAAIDEYNAALEELTRFVGEENADKIINEIGAKEYLDYLKGEGISSGAEFDAVNRLITADEAIDQINRDTERDLGYQSGQKAAEQMTDEELAAELMKASEEANDSMPTEFNLGYLNAISDTLRDRQKQAAEGNWAPKEGEPNEPKEETGDNNEPKGASAGDAPNGINDGNERNVGNVGNERNVGNGELPGNTPAEDAPTGEGDAPAGEGELGNKGADDSALSRVPVGEDGEPNFLAVDTATGWDALVEMIGNEDGAKTIAEAQADQAGKNVAAIRKREPQKGKVKLTGSVTAMAEAYKNAEKKYEEDHAAWESEMSAAVAKHERWQALAAEPEVRRKAAEEAEAKRKAEEEEKLREEEAERRRKAAEAERMRIAEEKERKRIEAEERKRIAKGDRELAKAYDRCKKYPEALEILRDDQPHDIYEAVSVALSGHKILLNDDGVRRGYKYETGLGEGERKRFFRMFATRENGGISIARLAEDIVQEICDVNGIRYDNNDARGVIIEMLASSDGPSDIYNYIRNRRIEQANSIVDQYEYEEECSLREDFWYEMHMTPEEWDVYNDYREEELKELDNHFRDFDFSEHYANIAERIEKEYANGKDINRKGESDAEGGGDQSNVPVGTMVRGEGLPKEGSSGEVSTGFENVKKDLLRSPDHGERLDREATGEGSDVGIGQAERGNGDALPEGVTEDGDVNGLAWGKDRVSHDNYGREIVHRNMYYNGEVIGVYYGKESGNLLQDGVEEYAISVPGLETKEDLMLPLYDVDGKDVREGGKEAPYKLDAGWISFNTKEEAVDFYKRNKDAIDKFNEAADADVSAEMRTLAKSLLDDKSLVEYANSVVYSKPGEGVGNGAEMGAELGKLVCERLLKDNPDISTKELFKVGNLFLGELLSPLNSENKGKQVRTSMVMPYYDALKERPETTLNRRLEMLKEKGVTPDGNPLNIDELADAYLNANREYNESYIDFLEDKIDENEWRRKGDELNKRVQSARKELEDAILSLSNGELKSIGATKDIEDVVNSILKDREENNRLADDFERLIETQGEIVGKSKSKYKLADIIDKKTDTKQLLGIYHDGGYAVASDKIVLVADKREYDEANDGKIVGLDGSVVDGQYPTWQAVMPKQISEIGLDPKGMLDFIAGVKAKAKSINPKQKRSELYVLINIGGNIQSYSLNQLEKFCNAAVSLDAKLYIMQREDSLVTLYAEGKNGCALIMPTTRPDFPLINENGVYAYNKPAANGETKASVWAGDAEGGKQLSEGDGDIGNNSGDGVEDYAEMDEYVPQTWDESSSLRDVEARLKLLEDAFYYPWEALGKKIFPEYIDFINEKGDLKDKYGSGDKVPKEEADALFAKYAGYIERYNAMREEIYSLRELRDRLEAKMSREQKEEESRREMAELLAKHNGYLRGMSNLRMWSVDRYLSKLKKIDGEVATVSEFIDRWLADGSLRISKREYKPQIDRRKWNRMSGKEQAAWEASHNKPKTEYLVNDYDLGKTAYDYARWLLSQKNKGKLGGVKPQERSIVEENGGDVVKEQKAVGTGEVSPREAALRDSLIGVLRDAGVEVVTDVEEGQRVLDKANGDAKVQAKIGGNEQKLRQHKVYHGSGADFDAFDHNHMSEGEGAQAYGWGAYVTEVEGIGRNYAIVNNNSLRKSRLESDIYRLKEALPFRRGEAKREGEEELKRLEEELSKFDETWRSVLYTVEIPDDTGSNYLHWDKPVGREKSDKISKALYDRILREDKDGSYEDEYSRAALRRELDSLSGIDGKDLYGTISAYLGGDKAASEFLRDNGFVGVSYPSQYRSGGRKDAARNYVVFDEKNMEITDKMKFFRRGDGEAYGYTVDGKIYIDPRIATAETPIHEYAHLWSAFMRKANPKGWGDIVKLMKECTDLWDQVARDYPELKTEDDIAEEVLTHYSGRRGAERLRAEMQRAMESAGKDVKKQTMIASMFEGVRRALSRFWRGVADLFHIRFTSAEDVADRVLTDMLNGFNPVEAGKKLGARAGVAEVKDSFERYRGRNPRARQLSLFGDDSKAHPEARQLSLFDDAEVDGSGRIIEPERQAEMDRNAEKVNSSLDEFTDEYAEYLRMLDETEGSEDFVPEEAEARVMDLRDKLVEDMMEYHRSAGMSEAEARKRSWELVNQTMTDINIALLRKGKSGNIELLPEETIKVKRMNESEEAKEWLPELGEGEYVTDEMIDRINARHQEMAQTSMEAKKAEAERLSAELNTPVRIITDAEGAASLPTVRQRRAKGFWSEKDGIVVVLSNHKDVADVAGTVLHEIVGHDGLRVLFPEKEKLDNALDELYGVSHDKIRTEIDSRTDKIFKNEVERIMERKRKEHETKGEDVAANYLKDLAEAHAEAEKKRAEMRREATEEYGADLADRIGEDGFKRMDAEEATFWGKFKAMLQKAFDSLLQGLRIKRGKKWTDKEWAFVLHEAWKRKRNGGKPSIKDMADTEAMRNRTGFNQVERGKAKDPEGKDIEMRYRDDEGLDEAITRMKVEEAAKNAGNLEKRDEAIRAIGGNLTKLHQAMARQREYDAETVKSITDLATTLMKNGMMDNVGQYEIKRVMSAVKGSVGKKDTSKQVQQIMDIMVDNQLKNMREDYESILKVKGTRLDATGVRVAYQLDAKGQEIMKVVKNNRDLTLEAIEAKMAEVSERWGYSDPVIREHAENEYAGLMMAKRYIEEIRESKAQEQSIKDSIKNAREDYQAGKMEEQEYREFVKAAEDSIREIKIERAESYRSQLAEIGAAIGKSVDRLMARKEAEKARINEIHHNANSDMEGRKAYEHTKPGFIDKFVNNDVLRFFMQPLATFDMMLRMFGGKNVRGEGYLWNRYMRGYVEATEKEYQGYKDGLKILDGAAKVIVGKRGWSSLYALDRKLPKMIVKFWDGGEMRDHELTQGNLMYIYMVNKMTDGRMKLRKMGILEGDMDRIENFLDPRFKELADWIQEEFLPSLRGKYNEVYKRMFGASMAAIENYFPLKILANARTEEVDVTEGADKSVMPSTKTGSVIERKRNTLALDITGANAISVILDHIQEMEHWAAFAEFNRDLNTLLSYKRFRNQVKNMSTAYGSGGKLWKNFFDACKMAAGEYNPEVLGGEKAAVNIAKGVTAAKISFRMFTALKQFASAPAYLSEANPVWLGAAILNPVHAWMWSIDNLPLFHKRWMSRMAGDPRLLKTELDWKMWRSRVVKMASKIGMSPNAFVDALTVSIGAYSIYKTRLSKYKRLGFDPEEAEKRAKQDATIAFNETQQSAESAFISTMQASKTWFNVLFTIFRNSSMSYTRQLHDALRNIKHYLTHGNYAKSTEFMAKQYVRDGVDESKARKQAKRDYRTGVARDLARVAIFGAGLQLVWNMMGYLPYLLLGDDEETKEEFWNDVWTHTMYGSIEGLTSGDVLSTALNKATQGYFSSNGDWKEMPAMTDLKEVWEGLGTDKVEALNDVVNLMIQSGFGVNPQSLTDAVTAVIDYSGDDANTQRECALLIARIMNCPPSQLEKVYFDEINATGLEARNMTPQEIARRYADYKVMREAPMTGWMYDAEERKALQGKYEKKSLSKDKEHIQEATTQSAGKKEYDRVMEEYERLQDKVKEIGKLRDEPGYQYEAQRMRFDHSPEGRKYKVIRLFKKDLNELTEQYLKAKNPDEMRRIGKAIEHAKKQMLSDIKEIEEKAAAKKMDGLRSAANE